MEPADPGNTRQTLSRESASAPANEPASRRTSRTKFERKRPRSDFARMGHWKYSKVIRMSIKLSCADFTWPLLTHDQSLALIATLGFKGVDLGIFGNRSHIRPEVIRDDVPMWAGILRERLDQHGLEPADVFLIPDTDFGGMAPNHPDPREREAGREAFTDVLDLACRLEAKGISSTTGCFSTAKVRVSRCRMLPKNSRGA